jgi:hypothetical protein
MAFDVGTGTTIVFGTSGFSASLLSLSASDVSREDIDITHMGSTSYREFMPGDLIDGGTIEMEIAFDPDDEAPMTGTSETITITFPIPSGASTAATFVFKGYVSSWSWSVPLEESMTATLTIKVDGTGTEPAWTNSA